MGKANAFSSLSWHALQVKVRHGETATLCSWRHKTSGHSGSVESSPMHQQTSWDTATAVWNFWELMANSFTAPNVTKPNQPKQMPEMTKEPGTTKTTPPSCGPRFTRNQHVTSKRTKSWKHILSLDIHLKNGYCIFFECIVLSQAFNLDTKQSNKSTKMV